MSNICFAISGKFILHAENAKTGEKRKLAEFDNLILDQGIERFLANQDSNYVVYYVQVGSGNAPPTPSDTALQNFVAGTARNRNVTVSNGGAPNYFGNHNFSWQFDVGTAAGNLSEIGIGWQANGGLFTRALIRDANGNPTTITVLPNEYLNVNYIVRVRPLLTDVTGTINLAGNNYAYTIRAASAGSFVPEIDRGIQRQARAYAYTGNIGSVTETPSGENIGTLTNAYTGGGFSWLPYTSGSMVRKFELFANVSQWNHTSGIKSILIDLKHGSTYTHKYQVEFNPAIPKTDTQTLRLEFGISLIRE